MDRKFVDVIYIFVPIILASQVAMTTSDSLLNKLGLSVTNFNSIIAGTVVGTVVCGGTWLLLVVVARLLGKGKN